MKEIQKIRNINSLTEQENEIICSSKSEKIKDISGTDIGKVFIYIFIVVGLQKKNIPNKDIASLIVGRLKKNYGNHTLSDLKLAFEMLSDGKLTGTNKIINGSIVNLDHYQNFSWVYVRTVMDSFIKLKSKAIIKNRTIIDRSKILPLYTKSKIEKDSYDWIIQYLTKNKKLPIGANWINAYNYAINMNLINLTIHQKKKWRLDVMICLNHEKENKNLHFLSKSMNELFSKESHLKFECKKRLIIKYFEDLLRKIKTQKD